MGGRGVNIKLDNVFKYTGGVLTAPLAKNKRLVSATFDDLSPLIVVYFPQANYLLFNWLVWFSGKNRFCFYPTIGNLAN